MDLRRRQAPSSAKLCSFLWIALLFSGAFSNGALAQAVNELCPVWSPVNDLVATPFRDASGNYDIYVVSIDGTTSRRLTTHSAKDSSPAWSPDGNRLVFQSNRDGNWNLYAINIDGSNLTRLTNEPGRETHPSWSPDGNLITFQTNRDGNSEVYVMAVDGSGLTRVTDNPSFDGIPHWSPSGDHIAFSSRQDGSNDILLFDRTSDEITNLTNTPTIDEYVHAWSSDGSMLSYWAAVRTDTAEEQYISVLTLQPSGSRQLTTAPALHRCPSWSPNGEELVFASNPEGSMGLYIVRKDGSGRRRLPVFEDAK